MSVRYGILSTLADLRRLADELDEADRCIAAHALRSGLSVLDAELRRLGALVSPVAAHVLPQEDDGDPEVVAW